MTRVTWLCKDFHLKKKLIENKNEFSMNFFNSADNKKSKLLQVLKPCDQFHIKISIYTPIFP